MKEFIFALQSQITVSRQTQDLVRNHPTMSEELKQWNIDRLEKYIQQAQSVLDEYTK